MKKRSMAAEIIGEFALYSKDAPNQPYSVRLNGKFFCSHCTADLADKVSEHFSKTDLVGLMDMIPREE